MNLSWNGADRCRYTWYGTFAKDLLPNIEADPDHFFDLPGCEIIKDQRKIKVARVKVKIQGDMKTVYLKRYNAFSWRYRFGSMFQSSGAVRSLEERQFCPNPASARRVHWLQWTQGHGEC